MSLLYTCTPWNTLVSENEFMNPLSFELQVWDGRDQTDWDHYLFFSTSTL